MIVLDASAAVELVLSMPLSRQAQQHVDDADWLIAAPQLLAVEVLQIFRRRVGAGLTSLQSAEEGRELLADLNVRYFDHSLLADRIWQLRKNLTADDASYVALSELADADLLTTDTKLANAAGHHARVTALQTDP